MSRCITGRRRLAVLTTVTATLALSGNLIAQPATADVTNGSFETGTLSGWTTAGTTSVVNSGAHSGTYAAQVGGTSPTNGNSSISQSFTAPTGSPTLSFWYDVFCPDTVTYDWATATLKGGSSATTRRRARTTATAASRSTSPPPATRS
ncbi:hypothetical protein ACWGCW_04650 [Streptomyces sp. NPDC054933]